MMRRGGRGEEGRVAYQKPSVQIIKLLYVLVQLTHVTIQSMTPRWTSGYLFSEKVEHIDIPDDKRKKKRNQYPVTHSKNNGIHDKVTD